MGWRELGESAGVTAAGLLSAAHNLEPVLRTLVMAPTSGLGLGNVTCENTCHGGGKPTENSWILLNPLGSHIGETEAAVIHFIDILIFCHVLSPVGEIKNTWAGPSLKSLLK